MASTLTQASQQWHNALKLRKALLKQLDGRRVDHAHSLDTTWFEAFDGLLQRYRLACVQTIFLDFQYAAKENTEDALWELHTSINHEYRQIVRRLRSNSHPVERRKAEKMYNNFLRIALKFYKGYIQRLSARYDIQELKRVVMGIEVEQIDAEDTISPVPGSLSSLVLESCHSTLLHLGDLCRYRSQAKNKSSSVDFALTYFSLARHLMPHSGFAFHQMGILNAAQGNHLDAVYHFYRAWAVEVPHPNVKANLEAKFNSLRAPNAIRPRVNPSAPAEAFSIWFVKLHAYFYAGEAFSQQRELEEEVMHRMEMACRDGRSGDTLLKMALVNMSAHAIASSASTEKGMMTNSNFWKFTLKFNALFISTLCRVIHLELEKVGATNSPDKPIEIPAVVASLLPVLRVYCVWFVAHRSELVAAYDAFGAALPMMMKGIVNVFTSFFAVACTHDELPSCSYLLPEDLELRGHQLLAGDDIPSQCRVDCKDDSVKPYLSDPQQCLPGAQENLARTFDVLRCAYFLHSDEMTPISIRNGEKRRVFFEYQPDMAPVVSESGGAKAPEVFSNQSPAMTPHEPSEQRQQDTSAEVEMAMATSADDDDDDAEKRVMSMLTPFLKPPTPSPQNHVRSPSDAAPGVESTPANGSGALNQNHWSPAATGRLSGPITPLPWAWDNTPKPDSEQAAGREAFTRGSRNNSPRDSMTGSIDDPFATPGRNDGARAHAPTDRRASKTASEEAHRQHMLQTLLGDNSARTSSPAQPRGSRAGASSMIGTQRSLLAADSTGFSHPSSLYMGTPAYGIGLGVTGLRGLGLQSPTQGSGSSARRVGIGDSLGHESAK
ncbi:hypothetical protein L249_8481 [Ophiocordyceps polyrhachis-furcata BCC 54312]|uniref:DNA/RNA-binding domain-containing protein n=1 Tax=Ophiocordyceps polyrhachis-furcata BCC 54312 TaxID=1330021 RepID=A0A367L663_9HYPO|nr:hypothetical protein L249_8481 [Ophiocordyceps polyrhachis-furcata BCC 54312]